MRALPTLAVLLVACAEGDVGSERLDPADVAAAPDGGADMAPTGCDRPERCDGLDDDCDGVADEGLSRVCGEASPGCPARTQRCEAGAWTACAGPQGDPEACDGADNDCDGAIDEGLTQACGVALGACRPGTERCVDGAWAECDAVGQPGAVPEACGDASDEDCDGTVDEGCACAEGERPCGADEGRCTPGSQPCVGGMWGACDGAVQPQPEVCDGVDDDCDGAVDEQLTMACGSEVGRCEPGQAACVMGAFGACVGAVAPQDEACNGQDDDCDGAVDEGVTRPCGGACGGGEERCVGGAWGACEGAVEPQPEACDGALDEDCDGAVDEGCDCADGAVRACGVAVGACRPGMETCADGRWGDCAGAVGPREEACDGAVDEDCDEAVDEGCDCVAGNVRACGHDVGACAPGIQRCDAGAWAECDGAVGPVDERCDGATDDDCDGDTDEGCDCVDDDTRPCGTDVGACRPGVETCAGGRWGACAGAQGPVAEACGGDDQDCDGTLDEGFRAVGRGETYADLRARHESCDGVNQIYGDNCLSAISRLCREGCQDTGFGPVENAAPNVFFVCVQAQTPRVSFADLQMIQPLCGPPNTVLGEKCSAAIDTWCRREVPGSGAGFGPIEHGGGFATVACLPQGTVAREQVPYATLRGEHPQCDGVEQRQGKDCNAAIHRWCQARGFESGVGPVQNQGALATVACVRR